MLQNGLRRTIVYVLPGIDSASTDDVKSAENECQLLSEILVKVAKEYHNINLNSMTILGKTSQGNRREYLTEFGEDNNGTFKVLLNCRVLDEGVDLPNCDSIFIAYGTKDKVRNIQRLYRCLRRCGNKTKGHCLFWGDDEDRTVNFLSSIREIDPEFKSKLRIQSTNYNEKVIEMASKSTRNLEIIDNLVVKAIPYQDFLKLRQDALISFLRKHARVPKALETHEHEGRVIKVGRLYSQMKTKGSYKNLLTKLINQFIFVKKDVELYHSKLQTDVRNEGLIDFLRTNNRLPKFSETYEYEGGVIKVGQLYSNAKCGGHNKELLTKLIEEFIFVKKDVELYHSKRQTEVKITSYVRHEGLIDFLRTNNRLPKYSETYEYEGGVIKVGKLYFSAKCDGHNKELLTKLFEDFIFVKNDIEIYQSKRQT